jgi:hypothetical protein
MGNNQKRGRDKNMSIDVEESVDARVRLAALALLELDKDFDDAKYTPPGSISLCIGSKADLDDVVEA